MSRPAVIAIDGGGSKIDAAAVARDGTLLGCARVLAADANGQEPGHLSGVAAALEAVCRASGLDAERRPLASLGAFCLAGADLPVDDRRILRWIERHSWTTRTLLRNDTFAVLRAGTDRTWGVGVVCGFGTNCSAVSPRGTTYRLPALGSIAGDWGGGSDIGEAALWYAIRSEDGRGARTALATSVPAHFGLRRPRQVMQAMYLGRLSEGRVSELPPLVFRAAADGDEVARSIVDRQADEVVTMAGTAIRRLRMASLDVDVVLGGGIFRTGFAPFFRRIELGLEAVAPRATVTVLAAPPVVGAVLLGLDRIGATRDAKARVRRALTDEALAGAVGRRGRRAGARTT
ncbi:MAG: N-acetylglucosamine kinase [Actinomycetota bacterium]